jgi:hypothetical protein
MPSKADTAVARTIGIDTGKNTLHMIGLDEKGAIVLRGLSDPDCRTICEPAAVPRRHRSRQQ